VLGKQWTDAAPIFAVLSVLGFLRPIEGSNWWLFVTQERAGEGLQWSLWGALISGVSVVIGLPWGAIGVATAVTAAAVLRLPWLIWYVARRGPVTSRDIYRALATPTLAALLALAVLLLLEPLAESEPPLVALVGGLAVTGVVFFSAIALLPSGRRTLRDAWMTVLSLRRRRRA
jgi:PST family polysaccharide transporter